MGRGFISGTLWGAVVGVFILLAATQIGTRQDMSLPQPAPADRTAQTPDASEFAEVTGGDEPVAPAPETAPGGSAQIAEAPAAPAPATDTRPSPDVTPLAAPAPAASAPPAPQAPDIAPAPEVGGTDAAPATVRDADVPAPGQPASDAPLVTGLDAPAPLPVQPPPVAETEVAALAPAVTDAAPVPPPVAETPAEAPLPPAPKSTPDIAQPSAAPERVPAAPDAPVPADGTAPRVTTPAQGITAPDTPQRPERDAGEDGATGPVVSAMPGQRAAPLTGAAADEAGATILPAPDNAAPAPAAPAPAAPAPEAAPAPASALLAFRAPFESDGDAPLLAVVLLVPADGSVPVESLASLPFPASYAIDAIAPNARDTAAALRAAGRELLLIPSLPAGATPADVEVALQANLAVVPEAVAFIDAPDASFQSDRTAVAQVVAAAGATGHGVVTFPRGLNTAQQIARRDGVPAGLVFRDLDGEGQDADTIRRTLDQAAFRARQEGAVILVGRARPETLGALTEWALGNRAASVALAPASAAILAQE